MQWTVVSKEIADWLKEKGASVRFSETANKWFALI